MLLLIEPQIQIVLNAITGHRFQIAILIQESVEPKHRDTEMKKILMLILLLVSTNVLNSNVSIAGETITTQEIDSYIYQGEKVDGRSKGQFEITYYIDGNTVTRTRVYDFIKKEVIPDNTVYQIQRQLLSDPTNIGSVFPYRVIRAIGQPGSDAIEILTISETHIQSVRSTNNYFVVSRSKRIK